MKGNDENGDTLVHHAGQLEVTCLPGMVNGDGGKFYRAKSQPGALNAEFAADEFGERRVK